MGREAVDLSEFRNIYRWQFISSKCSHSQHVVCFDNVVIVENEFFLIYFMLSSFVNIFMNSFMNIFIAVQYLKNCSLISSMSTHTFVCATQKRRSSLFRHLRVLVHDMLSDSSLFLLWAQFSEDLHSIYVLLL